AIALGADFTWVGRAQLYGLMAGGEAGADRAITILRGEVLRTMRLLGVRSLDELRQADVVRLRRQRR
ncbi:MAG: alpha-hydroxy-acid oxidizing protein, partial [Curtobacterium sp.]